VTDDGRAQPARHPAVGRSSQSLERQAHAARLATAGELIASIAHELAQPLAAILSNAEAGEKLIDSGRATFDEVRAILIAIRQDDDRASAIIQRLRDLLRRAPVAMGALDLNGAVTQVLALVGSHAAARGVRLESSLDASLPRVRGDMIQLQQVILNLVMNGIDAAGAAQSPRRNVLVRSRRRGDGSVAISVQDTGGGIDAGILPQIFEPFFTTKPGGMGLGLSISRSIVTAHGGTLSAQSAPGATVLRVVLPGCPEPPPPRPPRYTSHPPCPPS